MTAAELTVWAKGAILKIHVITGWIIPSNELLNVLIEQFQKKILESYPTINQDELEYAFRTYGTTVKDWGKQMNLSLIDEALIPYMETRRTVSHIEEQKKQIEIEPPKEDLSDTAMQDWLNSLKQTKPSIDFMPEMLYDWLIKKKILNPTKKEKWESLSRAAAYRQHQLYTQLQQQPNDKDSIAAYSEFVKMQDKGEITGIEVEKLKTLAKKIIMHDYILKIENSE